MMNDARDVTTPPVEVGNIRKIVAAVAIALGFVAIGAYSYESGTWNSSPKQIVAANSVTAPAPLASVPPSVTAPLPTTDLPPVPEKSAEAKPAPAAAAAAVTKTSPLRIARAQIPAVTPQVPPAPETPALFRRLIPCRLHWLLRHRLRALPNRSSRLRMPTLRRPQLKPLARQSRPSNLRNLRLHSNCRVMCFAVSW